MQWFFSSFDSSLPRGYGVLSVVSFICIFPNDRVSFHVLIGRVHICFGEMSTQVFCPFLNQLLSFWHFLCVLDINAFSNR